MKTQRQTIMDFAGIATWMTGNLSGYSKYVEDKSVAIGFSRFLTIPYAGEVTIFSGFTSPGVLSMNAASVAITRFLATSRQSIAWTETLDSAIPGEGSDLPLLPTESSSK